jgi:hypothetical protein
LTKHKDSAIAVKPDVNQVQNIAPMIMNQAQQQQQQATVEVNANDGNNVAHPIHPSQNNGTYIQVLGLTSDL